MTGDDLARALAHARAEARTEGAETLHALPLRITLDGSQPLRDPRGMIGRQLRSRPIWSRSRRRPCTIWSPPSNAVISRSRRWSPRPMPPASAA